MCVPVVTADRHVGASVVSICDDPVDCILGRLDDAVNGASKSGPARGVMAAFLATAKTLIIELDYFDIDYRSEIALIQPHSFSADRPQTQRWHFFSAPL